MFVSGVIQAAGEEARQRSTRLQSLLGEERGVQVTFLLELAAFDEGRQFESFG